MGVLVSFPTPQSSVRTLADGHSAAILFFTGVRYLRMDDAATFLDACAAAAPAKRRRAPRAKKPAAERLAQA